MKNKILALVLVLLSPIIYYNLISLFASKVQFPIMHTFHIKSLTLFVLIFIFTNAMCAILTALVTALPCSYLLGYPPKYIITLLSISILSFPVCAFITQSDFDKLSLIDCIGQCISVLIAVYYFANVGYRAAQRRNRVIP